MNIIIVDFADKRARLQLFNEVDEDETTLNN